MQPFPFLQRGLQEGFYDDGAGVIEQNRDPAELFHHALHRRFDLRLVRYVGDPVLGDMAALPDCRCGSGGSFAVAVDDRHLGALGREKLRGRTAHARRATRNDGDLAGQSCAHGLLPAALP